MATGYNRHYGAVFTQSHDAADSQNVFLVNLISALRTAENSSDMRSFSLMNINGNIKYCDSRLNEGQTGD